MIFLSPAFGSKPEGSKRSHDLRPQLDSLKEKYELEALKFGDFMFLGHGPDGPISVGIELKTISDFVTSMLSGRLAGHQIPGLLEVYPRAYLIIEGVWRLDRKSGLLMVPRGRAWRPIYAGRRPVFWDDVQKFITGLEEVGVRLRYTRSSYETVRTIARVLKGFWSKPYDEHRSFRVLYRPTPLLLDRDDPVTRRIRSVAKALDCLIGWERTKAVAKQFSSVHEMINAGVEEWEQIDGIGKGIAGGVVKAIRERYTEVSSASKQATTVRGKGPAAGTRARHRGTRHSG